MDVTKLFDCPKIIGVVGDVNSGKSMVLYNIINKIMDYNPNLYHFGLRCDIPNSTRVYSIKEIESVTNSIIIIDELSSLFDLDDRKQKKLIENTFRLLNHNNNVIILCGVPENFKKFVSSKVNQIFYKTSTISDFINGSSIKHTLTSFNGNQRGSEMLNMRKDEALYYDGSHYTIIPVEYLEDYDTKKHNQNILQKRGD